MIIRDKNYFYKNYFEMLLKLIQNKSIWIFLALDWFVHN